MKRLLFVANMFVLLFTACKSLHFDFKKGKDITVIQKALQSISRDSTFIAYCTQKELDCNAYFIQKNPTHPWLFAFAEDYRGKSNVSFYEVTDALDLLELPLREHYLVYSSKLKNRYYIRSKKRDLGVYWFPIAENEFGLIVVGEKNNRSLNQAYLTWGNNSLYYWVKIQGQKVDILYRGDD